MVRSKYSTLRSNIMKQQKRLYATGFESPENWNPNPLKVKELGHKPTDKDIEYLLDYQAKMRSSFTLTVSDDNGKEKELKYDEARKYLSKQAYKKGQYTKLINKFEDDDIDNITGLGWIGDYITPINKPSYIIDDVKQRIFELVFFNSHAKNFLRNKINTEMVSNIGSIDITMRK